MQFLRAITSTAAVVLLFGTIVPVYAQHEPQGEKQAQPEKQQSRPQESARPAAQQPKPQQPQQQQRAQPLCGPNPGEGRVLIWHSPERWYSGLRLGFQTIHLGLIQRPALLHQRRGWQRSLCQPGAGRGWRLLRRGLSGWFLFLWSHFQAVFHRGLQAPLLLPGRRRRQLSSRQPRPGHRWRL